MSKKLQVLNKRPLRKTKRNLMLTMTKRTLNMKRKKAKKMSLTKKKSPKALKRTLK